MSGHNYLPELQEDVGDHLWVKTYNRMYYCICQPVVAAMEVKTRVDSRIVHHSCHNIRLLVGYALISPLLHSYL